MINKLLDLFKRDPQQDQQVDPSLAAAALLFEVVWADHDIDAAELLIMCKSLKQQFQLTDAQVDALVEQTKANHEASVGVYEFTRTINEHLDQQQKYDILVAMWRVAMADNQVDAFEEHTVRRIAELLYVPHQLFIAAKHAARDASD